MNQRRLSQELDNDDLITVLSKEETANGGEALFSRKTYKRHEYIYLPGDESDRIFIIINGSVKVGSHSNSAKAIIKNVWRKGEFFGEFSIIGQITRVDFAVARETTELYSIKLDNLKKLMDRHEHLMNYIMNVLGKRLMKMERKVESFVLKNSRTRIIDFLSDLVNSRGHRVGFEMEVRKFFTHQEIASITATSRQTVTMVLNELRNKNILTFNRRRLLIRDLDMLRAEVA